MPFIDQLLSHIPPRKGHLAPLRLLLTIYRDRLVDMPDFPTAPAGIHSNKAAQNQWLSACRNTLLDADVFLQDDPIIQKDRLILDVAFYMTAPVVLDELEIGFDSFEMQVDLHKEAIRPKVDDYPLAPVDGDDVFAQWMNAFINEVRQQDKRIRLTALLYALQNMNRQALNELIQAVVEDYEGDVHATEGALEMMCADTFFSFHKALRQTDVDPCSGRDMLLWHLIHDWDKEGLLFDAWRSFVCNRIEC